MVVTDNERIFGLGDQGAGGMAIPVGKLTLYTAAGGIHPAHALPISLDVGTDNPDLLDDELYLGWRWPRLKGADYDGFVEEFVNALKKRFPRAIVQWEDLKRGNAFRLLERFRRTIPSFNDDIQGTAAVVLAGILSAGKITGRPLEGERIVIVGAGAAGIGIARLLRDALYKAGLRGDDLVSRLAVIDSHGLLVEGGDIVGTYKREYAWPAHLAAASGLRPGARLEEVVQRVHPTVLVGVCGRPGVFTEREVRAMAAHVERPVILPMSNPAEVAEADPADLMQWTEERALVATGSPFSPVSVGGRTHRIGQANNVFIFPAIGIGSLVAKATQITDGMFLAAARALADQVTAEERAQDALFPAVWRLREVTARVAEAVVRAARDEGVGLTLENGAVARAVTDAMWEPVYPTFDPSADRPAPSPDEAAAIAASRSL